MSIVEVARRRYATKAYDNQRKIPQPQIDELLNVLRASPSSVNTQPWHFVVAASDKGKGRVAKAAAGNFSYNAAKVQDASHVIVLCGRTDLTADYLETVTEQEAADGRYINEQSKANGRATRESYVSLHREQLNDLPHWISRQVYLALGGLLLAAGTLDIDATPMEGLDLTLLDQELGLTQQGFAAQVVVALGYHSDNDFNATLPKSRLPAEQIFTHL